MSTAIAIATQGPLPRRPRARQDGDLSPREREVLALVLAGKTSKEAATALFISKRCVDFHVYNAYKKLDVTTRLAAYHKARRMGLVQ